MTRWAAGSVPATTRFFAQQDKNAAFTIGTNETPYTTTVNTYTVRDQLKRVCAYQGSETSSVFQDTNLAGQLKSLTDMDGRVVNYNYNQAGQLSSVTGSGYNVTQLAANFQYRAWGDLKHYDSGYNLNTSVNFSYDARMRLSHFELLGPTGANPRATWMKSDYQYFADHRVRFAEDNSRYWADVGFGPTPNHTFNRAYAYDLAGRMTDAFSGSDAGGSNESDRPYKETYQYDVWGHMTGRTNVIWDGTPDSYGVNYVNNRNQGGPGFIAWQYDANGNPPQDDNGTNVYDAAGRKVTFTAWLLFVPFGSWNPNPNWNAATAQVTYDGDGRMVRETDTSGSHHKNMYYVPSTVLGGKHIKSVVSEWDDHSPSTVFTQQRVSIYANGARLAGSENDNLGFEYADPVTGRRLWGVGSSTGGEVETDPLGQEVGTTKPLDPESEGNVGGYPEPHEYGNADDPSLGCTLDGMVVSCSDLRRQMEAGATQQEYWSHSGGGWHLRQEVHRGVEKG